MSKAPRRSSRTKKARNTSGPMSGSETSTPSALVADAGGSSEDSVVSLSLGKLLDVVGERVHLEMA